MSQKSIFLLAALNYTDLGYSVIPLKPKNKKPPLVPWEKYQKQRATEEQIRNWWEEAPGANIGIVTGAISGIVIIDWDGDQGGVEFIATQSAKEGLTIEEIDKASVITGSGGRHIYFKHPGFECRNFVKQKGLDLRGDGGYVVVPPSVHPNGSTYKWKKGVPNPLTLPECPKWLLEMVDKSTEKIYENIDLDLEEEELEDIDKYQAAEHYLKQALTHANIGNRNDTGFWLACQLRDLGLSEDEAEDFMRQYVEAVPKWDHPYTLEEALASFKSAYKGEPRKPAIPKGVKKNKKTMPSGAIIEEVSLDPKIAEILIERHTTDAGNAECFKDLFADRFCYVPQIGKWLCFDGVRWKESNEDAELAMLETVRLRGKAAMSLDDDDRKTKLVKWALSSESNFKLGAALSIASAMLKKEYTEFDCDPYLFGCANGVLDLNEGLRPAQPEDRLHRSSTNVRYDPTATCDRWLKFLDEIFLDDAELIDFIHRAVGYTLSGDTSEQCLFILYGIGENGKSTFLGVLENLMGEYGISTPASTFKERRGDDTVPNDIARMYGARFVKAIEVRESAQLNEERIKALTGGDRISARFLHKEWFDFTPVCKVWFGANHKPIIQGTDKGIWRRIRLIPFEASFPPEKREPNLRDKLREELPGILAWAHRGFIEWQKRGLETVEKVKKATEVYRTESDIVEEFLSECTIQNPNTKVRAKELHREYTQWCYDMGIKALEGNAFGRRLTEKDFKRVKDKKGYMCYQGLDLKLNLSAKDEP